MVEFVVGGLGPEVPCEVKKQNPARRYGEGVKNKVFLYSFQSVGPGSDPGVQAVSQKVTLSHSFSV